MVENEIEEKFAVPKPKKKKVEEPVTKPKPPPPKINDWEIIKEKYPEQLKNFQVLNPNILGNA